MEVRVFFAETKRLGITEVDRKLRKTRIQLSQMNVYRGMEFFIRRKIRNFYYYRVYWHHIFCHLRQMNCQCVEMLCTNFQQTTKICLYCFLFYHIWMLYHQIFNSLLTYFVQETIKFYWSLDSPENVTRTYFNTLFRLIKFPSNAANTNKLFRYTHT